MEHILLSVRSSSTTNPTGIARMKQKICLQCMLVLGAVLRERGAEVSHAPPKWLRHMNGGAWTQVVN